MRYQSEQYQESAFKERKIISEGDYDFQVSMAVEKISKSGNEMIELILDVYDQDGNKYKVWDYLVSTPKALFKIKNFCEAVGLGDKFKSNELTADECVDMHGRCHVGVRPATGEYKESNNVDYYIESKAKLAPVSNEKPVDDLEDSDIPF